MPTISSSFTFSRHECMPPQQISPSATRNSPWSSAILPASRKVSAIIFVSAGRVLVPLVDAGRGIDADAAGRADADLAHLLADGAGLADLVDEALAVVLAAHRRAAAGAAPDRRDDRADLEAEAGDVVGHAAFTSSGVESMSNMRVGEPQVDAVEFLAVDLGIGGQLKQRVERDDRLAVAAPLPTMPGHIALWSFG